MEDQRSLIHGARIACASLPLVKNPQKRVFFGSKISKGCFDMKTLGLESQKAVELAGLLGLSVQGFQINLHSRTLSIESSIQKPFME